ncbi:hypothetical protein TUM12370_02090 [Salmonella enterica subsp. enterica serovar Choleraesuis]|nr:hypothetical protein TUM12370_02090 [Salmonella enterica subsp. enterica serovar Choleraesuis]
MNDILLRNNNNIDDSPLLDFQDDVQTLRSIFALPEINYADISQSEHLAVALKRWPLLAEFSHTYK